MLSLNKVLLIGNITKDLELKSTPNGHNVCSFGLATNKKFTNKDGEVIDKPQFHNIVLWAKTAEIACQYASKWDKIYIEWELDTRSYEKWDEKRYVTEIIGHNIILLWNKKWETTKAVVDNKEEEISVEDLPFS